MRKQDYLLPRMGEWTNFRGGLLFAIRSEDRRQQERRWRFRHVGSTGAEFLAQRVFTRVAAG